MDLRRVLTKLCIAFAFPVFAIWIILCVLLFSDPENDSSFVDSLKLVLRRWLGGF
jgi:hypothetical protein